MFHHPRIVWLQEAQNLDKSPPEKIFILIYAEDSEIAKRYIQYYQQKNQLCLDFPLSILPLAIYLQRHSNNEEFAEKLFTVAEKLSENQPIILFYPHRELLQQTSFQNLAKRIYAIPSWAEQCATSFFPSFTIPNIISSHLWHEESENKCYAVINAAQSPFFPSLFQTEGIHYACLFQGEKAQTHAQNAPYLVSLTKGHDILPRLFCRSGENYAKGINYGERNIGIFFHSHADFDELLKHFRKLLILPDYTGHFYTFRFFDPITLERYLDRLQNYPTKLATFFNGAMIKKIFCIKQGDELIEFEPIVDLSKVKQAKKMFDKFEIDAWIQQRDEALCQKIVAELMSQYPKSSQPDSKAIVENTVYHAYRLVKAANMKETLSILQLALAQLIYGNSLNCLDPEKKLNEILMSNLTEMEKQFYIEKRLDELETQGRIRAQ